MPPKGHEKSFRRSIPGLPSLPRALYGRTESLPNRALTRRHSHPWVQLSYAIQGVLDRRHPLGVEVVEDAMYDTRPVVNRHGLASAHPAARFRR